MGVDRPQSDPYNITPCILLPQSAVIDRSSISARSNHRFRQISIDLRRSQFSSTSRVLVWRVVRPYGLHVGRRSSDFINFYRWARPAYLHTHIHSRIIYAPEKNTVLLSNTEVDARFRSTSAYGMGHPTSTRWYARETPAMVPTTVQFLINYRFIDFLGSISDHCHDISNLQSMATIDFYQFWMVDFVDGHLSGLRSHHQGALRTQPQSPCSNSTRAIGILIRPIVRQHHRHRPICKTDPSVHHSDPPTLNIVCRFWFPFDCWQSRRHFGRGSRWIDHVL